MSNNTGPFLPELHKLKDFSNSIEPLADNLLISQSKHWIENKKFRRMEPAAIARRAAEGVLDSLNDTIPLATLIKAGYDGNKLCLSFFSIYNLGIHHQVLQYHTPYLLNL